MTSPESNQRQVRRRLTYAQLGRSELQDTLRAYLDENAHRERMDLRSEIRMLRDRIRVSNELNDTLINRVIDLTDRLENALESNARLRQALYSGSETETD